MATEAGSAPGSSAPSPAWFLGPVAFEYRPAWELQRRLQAARIAGAIPDVVLLVEHPPVITLGRGADAGNVLLPPEVLRERGIEVVRIERGGDVTYHGPGQLTGYPVLDLRSRGKDLHAYLRGLEEVMLSCLATYGIEGHRVEGMTGAWVGDEKVGAIGIKVRNWVTMHGFAFNVDLDPEDFAPIVPCGLVGRGVTSLARLLPGGAPSREEVAARLRGELARVFEIEFEDLDRGELEFRLGRAEASRTPPS